MIRRFVAAACLSLLIASVPASCAKQTPPPAATPSVPAPPPAPASVAPPAPAELAIPSRLGDQEFWSLVTEFSEPNGTFRSDNLLSNEIWLQYVIPDLLALAPADRVYMGVGPEQNFTYIAALKPSMAFIVDVRRGNLDLHLMYKALFELSSDRADFVSRLFSRKRPEGLSTTSSAQEIFAAFANVEPSEALFDENLKAILDCLSKTHGFTLTEDDGPGIKYVYQNFLTYGPGLTYWMSGRGGGFGRNSPSYADLMLSTDESGQPRSYLATEENFALLKSLESRNLLVPLVGNFAGPKAIRAVGSYLRERHAVVSAFYLSNVEQYLNMDSLWLTFCANVAALPVDGKSRFIRSVRTGQYGYGPGLTSVLGVITEDIKQCASGAGAAPEITKPLPDARRLQPIRR
jgi:hypothetical protein